MKILRVLAAFAFAFAWAWASPVFAWRNGKASTAAPQTQVNVPGLTQPAYPTMNFLKMLSCCSVSNSTFFYPGVLDANGYPNNGAIPVGAGNTISATLSLPTSHGTGDWRYGATNTSGRQLVGTSGITWSANTNCTINGSSAATGNVTGNITIAGTNCRLKFFFTGGTPASSTWNWPNGTYTNMVDEYLVRDSDFAAFQAGGVGAYFTPEFKSFYQNLNLKTVRTMDWAGTNNDIIPKIAYQPNPSSSSFAASRWEPTCLGGLTTFSEPVYTPGNSPSGFSGLVQGACIQLQLNVAPTVYTATGSADNGSGTTQITFASTSGLSNGTIVNLRYNVPGVGGLGFTGTVSNITATTIDIGTFPYLATNTIVTAIIRPSLNVAGTGNVPMLRFSGTPLISGDIVATGSNGITTWIYDAALNMWLGSNVSSFISGGFSTSSGNAFPLEYQIALANFSNADLWTTIPVMYDDASVVAHNTKIQSLLNSSARALQETGNELWNTNNATGYFTAIGLALGFPQTFQSRPMFDVYALKMIKHTKAARTVWGSDTRFRAIAGFQAFSGQGTNPGSNNDIYRLQGADLVGATYPIYCAYVGGSWSGGVCTGDPLYNTAPNRPVDIINGPNSSGILTYATYNSGAQAQEQSFGIWTGPVTIGGPNGGLNQGIKGAADDYASMIPAQIQRAFDFMSWDNREGVLINVPLTSVSSSGDALFTAPVSTFLSGTDKKVAFNTTGTFDANIVKGQNYFALPITVTTFKISNSQGGTPITVSGASSGTLTYAVAGDNNHSGGATLLTLASGATGGGAISGVYPGWNATALTYGLTVELYEGGTDPHWPTNCATLGLTSDYCGIGGKIDNLINAWKADASFQSVVNDQFAQFMANSQSRVPSWYGIVATQASNNQWALRSPDLFGTNFKSYDAIQNFRYPFLLKRDIDPASNDNDPMWLEKAA